MVVNKGSLDRGYGRCMVLKKHAIAVRRYANQTRDRLVAPPAITAGATGGAAAALARRYRVIDVDGLPRVGEPIQDGEILVNKETPVSTGNAVVRETPLEALSASRPHARMHHCTPTASPSFTSSAASSCSCRPTRKTPSPIPTSPRAGTSRRPSATAPRSRASSTASSSPPAAAATTCSSR